jgi:RimJ/RimL family protein N-acetyltransferase
MFTINQVTLRALDRQDLNALYEWMSDPMLSMLAGWPALRTQSAFLHKYEQRIMNPPADRKTFALDYEGQFVGLLELAMIDHEQRRAAISIVLGVKELWGRGIGRTGLRLLLDYGFTVQNLERIYAEVYGFNQRSQRLMETVGFQKEGVLRQHELHNGQRQDLYFYGLLKEEFYTRYKSIFQLPS